ncbi:MAG: hypothetical protein NC418_03545 [Muribaculaceae bacterium]|nr:hypothetical protein [Muribaculaceae bacterium]
MTTISEVKLSPAGAFVDGRCTAEAPVRLAELYRSIAGDYPKFFKMDGLCKVAFLAAELLLAKLGQAEKESAAIVLFNRSGSLTTDRHYQDTLSADNYFPSPAIFVYTLANIATGEIAIRHKIFGESSFYILDSCDRGEIDAIVAELFTTSQPSAVIAGWVEYENDNDFTADFRLIKQ